MRRWGDEACSLPLSETKDTSSTKNEGQASRAYRSSLHQKHSTNVDSPQYWTFQNHGFLVCLPSWSAAWFHVLEPGCHAASSLETSIIVASKRPCHELWDKGSLSFYSILHAQLSLTTRSVILTSRRLHVKAPKIWRLFLHRGLNKGFGRNQAAAEAASRSHCELSSLYRQ